MIVQTHLSKSWLRRQIIASIALIALGGWFYYDGWIAYPRRDARYDQFTEWETAGKTPDEMKALARERGWPEEKPEKKYGPTYIAWQIYLGHVAVAGGILAAAWLVISMRQKLSCDATTIFGVNGERVPFSAITEIDLRKWDSKGIAYAAFEDHGKTGRLTIDDYKFTGAEAILDRAKASLAANPSEDLLPPTPHSQTS